MASTSSPNPMLLRLAAILPAGAIACAILGPHMFSWSTAESRSFIIYWVAMCGAGLVSYLVAFTRRKEGARFPTVAVIVATICVLLGIVFTVLSLPFYLKQ